MEPEQDKEKKMSTMVNVSDIIAYENGEMSDHEMVKFFASLVENGMAWSLQGHYGRTANSLIRQGYINERGVVNPFMLPPLEEAV
jgi:hypothetical protein